ncbi:hypothetical protein ACLOJK_038093 [Asimina triloba]
MMCRSNSVILTNTFNCGGTIQAEYGDGMKVKGGGRFLCYSVVPPKWCRRYAAAWMGYPWWTLIFDGRAIVALKAYTERALDGWTIDVLLASSSTMADTGCMPCLACCFVVYDCMLVCDGMVHGTGGGCWLRTNSLARSGGDLDGGFSRVQEDSVAFVDCPVAVT